MCEEKKNVNIVLLSNMGNIVDGERGKKCQKVSEFEEGNANAHGPRHRLSSLPPAST